MSIQFGRWISNGGPVDPVYLDRVHGMLGPYASDGRQDYSAPPICISYFPFHTARKSRCEIQPYVSPSGVVITWSGRLDNREELLRELNQTVFSEAPDVSIVASAWDRFGTKTFGRLIGDWSLSIWDPHAHTVLLAKDFLGTQRLYYSLDGRGVTWCSVLDPLVLTGEKPWKIDEEYLAGLLSFFPAAHLTPYVGIHAVPPSSFVLLKQGTSKVERYWEFCAGKRIRYRSDAEYEEHFRCVFTQAVRRRLRSDSPVLAELSGGLDSSSIVCVADRILAAGHAETPGLDTVSYYHDGEPNWNERPYFERIESQRGRTGHHIPANFELDFRYEQGGFAATPGAGRLPGNAGKQFSACFKTGGYRVVLSGIGGDEVLGGVPSPTAELADLCASLKLLELGRQLKAWALTQRKPVLHLLANTLKAFLPIALVGVPKHERPLPWLDRQFVRRNLAALEGYPSRLKLFGPRPSFAENLLALDGLRRQLACSAAPAAPQYERRFPYLDRDLLEFLYALPREQLVRPHQRRSLMRRALAGIVPHEVLNRKRKAFISRGPLAAFSADLERSLENAKSMISSAQGIVNPDAFAAALQEACSGGEVPLVSLLRTLSLASWIRHMTDSRFWVPSGEAVANPPRPRKLVTDEGGHYLRLVFNVRTNRWSSGV